MSCGGLNLYFPSSLFIRQTAYLARTVVRQVAAVFRSHMQNFKNRSFVVLVILLHSSVEWAKQCLLLISLVVFPCYLVLCIHNVERVDQTISSSASLKVLIYTFNFGLVMWFGFESLHLKMFRFNFDCLNNSHNLFLNTLANMFLCQGVNTLYGLTSPGPCSVRPRIFHRPHNQAQDYDHSISHLTSHQRLRKISSRH